MIGWKCSVAIIESNTMVDNINLLTFIDNNVPFTVATTETNIDPFSIDLSSYETAYSTIYGYIGEDVNSIYAFIGMYSRFLNNPLMSIIKNWFPSYDLAYPNLYNYCKENTSANKSTVIYLPSLKRAIHVRFNSSSNMGLAVYEVREDGGVIRLPNTSYYSTSPIVTSVGDTVFINLAIGVLVNYSSPDDLLNINNYRSLIFDVKDSNGNCRVGCYRVQAVETELNFISSLFGYTTMPDFTIIPPPNPYEPGGPSGPTDPDLPPGTFDETSDPIPDSPLPTLSAANTGFTRIYNPTLSQVQNLAQYLWTTPDLIETIWNHIKQFFEDPMQAIIGFNLVPCPVPDGGTENFKLLFIDTGVVMTVAANQFVDVDCGTVQIKRYYGSALDQAPNTKVTVFLPYIGMVQVNTDEVMGTTLQVKYRIDICSGSCVAKIFVDGSVIYQYSGHCAVTIPISSADFSTYVSAAINVAKLAVGAATAGASGLAAEAASIAGGASQQTNQIVEVKETSATERNPATGRQITTGTTRSVTTTTLPQDTGSTQASFSGLSPSNISNTVGQIMGSKPNIQHSGSFSGNSGYLGVRRPYVIIERPNMCMPANYQALNGFPAMITMELSTCKGFTRIQQVQLTGMTATNPEQAEILELLKGGVVF